ncbi:MAG: Vacuolar fusion protein mon1 [Phylliscum demangeonii]|nr:MAG: Vacuolar fusion protein mon1 [Phylliscum demangeonii]
MRSYMPSSDGHAAEVESLLGEMMRPRRGAGTWPLNDGDMEAEEALRGETAEDRDFETAYAAEFEPDDGPGPGGNDEAATAAQVQRWKSRLKHFLILSSAGKPIYSRHGNDDLVSEYFGVVQTLISAFETTGDRLKSFTAGRVRFVVLLEGALYLVAISRLGESEGQMVAQLEALYMQILSTLTLPTLQTLFSHRPSTDLRKPLQGTEVLLSALADSFTRGSPTTLLNALECLRLRQSHRQIINSAMLRSKAPSLLYGLIVAGGRLVSVVRPRKHSLHPSDLQLIFNMLFEAKGIKADEGESWIPVCLPAFNNRGYLYMYVSFLEHGHDETDDEEAKRDAPPTDGTDHRVALLLISADKESFFSLQRMRDHVTAQLRQTSGGMALIQAGVRAGRPTAADIAPGTVVRHFLYKSRANVQFVMPSLQPGYATPVARRRLFSIYQSLHASAHAKTTHLRIHHRHSRASSALAWLTPSFELYCVAGPHVPKAALAQAANELVKWVAKEEARLFILGGAVF